MGDAMYGNRMLRFSDDAMFRRVMRDEGIARGVIQAATGIEVGRIEYLNTEQEAAARAGARGIRMDVYAKAGGAVYDIEMQNLRQAHLGKRFRYYQSSLDSWALKPGEGFARLKRSFVVFFCLHDPFGKGAVRYTIEPTCSEEPSAEVGSGQTWIAYNAKAFAQASTPALRGLLEYVYTGHTASTGPDELCESIDAAVEFANRDEEWRCEMLSQEDRELAIRDAAWEDGMAEGTAEAFERMAKLKDALKQRGRIGELVDALGDSRKLEALMREFGI